MIYKFIDENGSEITVNTLSSLQSLVESNTIKKKTKIKSGLRGKWTEASKIEELKDFFVKKEQSPTPLVEDEEVQIEEIAEVETVPELGNVEVKKPAEIVTDAIIVEEELPIQAEDKQVEKEKENNSISEEEKIISERVFEIFSRKRNAKPETMAAPAANLNGRWDLSIQFFSSISQHSLTVVQDGN